jgi:hypothetical protein
VKTALLVSLRLCVHRDGSILLMHRAGSTLRFGVELHRSDTVGQLLDTVGLSDLSECRITVGHCRILLSDCRTGAQCGRGLTRVQPWPS